MSEKYYLAFDIETSPYDYDSDVFSESQKEYLIRGAKSPEEVEKKISEMGLTPLTAQVITIGLKVISETNEGFKILKTVALMTNNDFEKEEDFISETEKDDNGCEKVFYQTTERNTLELFWKLIKQYKNCTLISFNGRNFDVPFLMLRSAILGIKPTRNLMEGTKFNYPLHIDLIDELTFYSASSYGATKRFNFDFYTRAFGLVSPKSEGIDGSQVSIFFKNKDYKTIADYCLRDVEATWLLFLKVKEYLFIK